MIEDEGVYEKAVDYRSQGRVVSGCSSGASSIGRCSR